MKRRAFIKTAGAVAAGITSRRASAAPPASALDVAVVGAGAFGAWTAWHLRRAGRRVALVDAYGPGNSRASSGGETRVIRMGYGADEVYTRWSRRSLDLWKDLAAASGQKLFHETGVLWMARTEDRLTLDTLATL